jgi:phospholipid/cholesterol/gamma-HCH transport system substrate-binding protein
MSREKWVGLFFFVGLVLLALLSFVIDDEGKLFSGGYKKRYFALLDNVGQVSKGSIVRMAGTGVQIGRVDEIELWPLKEENRYTLKMHFSIKDDFKIAKDSEVQLAMTTLLQGMHLEITPGSPGADELDPGSEVAVGKAADLMGTVAALGDTLEKLGDGGLGKMLLGSKGMEDVGEILGNLASDGGLGKWVLGKEAQGKLDPALDDLRKAAENVRKGTEGKGTLARILHDEELGSNVDAIVADLRETMKGVRTFAADISEGKGVIARLAQDEELGKKLDEVVTDVRDVMADIRGGKSALSRIISDEDLGTQLGRAVKSLADFAENLATGEGTIARLVNDPELFTEAKRLIFQAREAVEDAREAAPISAFSSVLFGAVQ